MSGTETTYAMSPAEQAMAGAAATERKARHHRILQSMSDQLWNADPDCDHKVVDGDNYSGIKCAKCPGWHCA